MIEPVVLNAGGTAGTGAALSTVATELRQRLATLAARHADPYGYMLDYRGIAADLEWPGFVEATWRLRRGRPEELRTPEEQIAFWANLYNALTLHAIVALDIRQGVGEVHEFFRRVLYDVGGQSFALVHIEHGVLRQNRPSRNQPEPVFAAEDVRRRWIVARLDPRVHFTLMCGARSCPPIRAWDAAHLDTQLDLAVRAFVNDDVEVDAEAGRVTLSRIFSWYGDDFGDVLAWVLPYLDPGPARDWLAAHWSRARIVYRAYDWKLNDRAPKAVRT